MTPDEARQVTLMLAGAWPQPPMDEVQGLVWRSLLERMDYDLGLRAVDVLVHGPPREFRPNASQFVAVVRGLAHHERTEERLEELPSADRVASPEYASEWVARSRERLAACRGPMAKALRDAMGRWNR